VGKENRSGIRDLFSFPTFSFLAKTVIHFSLPMKLALLFALFASFASFLELMYEGKPEY
jgi:hypothetical protein